MLHRATQETIRKLAVARVERGEPVARVMASFGYHRTSAYPWLRALREKGPTGLKSRKAPGRPPKFPREREREVIALLDGKDPRDYGYEEAVWSRELVAHLVEQQLDVSLSVPTVGRILRRQGFSLQKPQKRAAERTEEVEKAVEEWKQETLPLLQRRARRKGWDLFFLDEMGARSNGPLEKTWARRGSRPKVKVPARRQSVNAIGAVAPDGGFWFHTYKGRLNATLFCAFLLAFVLSRPRPVMLVLDSHPAHTAAMTQRLATLLKGRLELHFLPPYAPELNPSEQGWAHLKRNGLSRRPLRQGECLHQRVHRELSIMKSDTLLLRSFFRHPDVGCFVNA